MAQAARDGAFDQVADGAPESAGRGVGSGAGGVEPYDFRTGSELSREALSQLRTYCERLAAALGRVISAYLDAPARFEVLEVEGSSLEEMLAETQAGSAVALVELTPPLPTVMLEIDQALIGAVVGRMLGGPPEEIDRPATALECALLARFSQEVMDLFATAWDRLARCRPTVTDVLAETVQLQAGVGSGPGVREGETVRVRIPTTISGVEGTMTLWLPVGAAQRLLGDRTTQSGKQRLPADEQSLRQMTQRSLKKIVVPVTVILHRSRILLSEAMSLREGDVVPLGKPVGEPALIAVRDQPKFRAETGVMDGRLAAKVLGPCDGGARRGEAAV